MAFIPFISSFGLLVGDLDFWFFTIHNVMAFIAITVFSDKFMIIAVNLFNHFPRNLADKQTQVTQNNTTCRNELVS